MPASESQAATGSGYYVWWFPGAPFKVHLSLDLVSRLREQIRPEGPGIVQGFLFGRTRDGVTEILDIERVAGSPVEAVAAAEAGGRQLVGYYRAEAGDKLRLNDRDLALAQAVLTKASQVILLIQPAAIGPPNASFFFRNPDGKMSPYSVMDFPLETSLLADEEHEQLGRSLQAAARRAAVELPPPRVRSGSRKRRKSVLVVLAGAAFVALSAGTAAVSYVFERWLMRPKAAGAETANPPLPALSMGLRAIRQNEEVEITWSRESPIVAAATSGVLSIEDGDHKRDMLLSSTDARKTTIVYVPMSDRIVLRLAITTPVATVTESLVVILPAIHKPATTSATGPAPLSRAVRPFTPPPVTTTAPAPEPMPPLPLLRPAPASPLDTDRIPILLGRPVEPPPPVNGPAVAAAFHPAEPVRRTVPRVPFSLHAVLPKPTDVEVRVDIDRSGRVTRAEAVPQPGINSAIRSILIDAARSWVFTPARTGDEPVASEYVIQFRFAR